MKKGDKVALAVKRPDGKYDVELDEVESVRNQSGKKHVKLKRLKREVERKKKKQKPESFLEEEPLEELHYAPPLLVAAAEQNAFRPVRFRLNAMAMELVRKFDEQQVESAI